MLVGGTVDTLVVHHIPVQPRTWLVGVHYHNIVVQVECNNWLNWEVPVAGIPVPREEELVDIVESFVERIEVADTLLGAVESAAQHIAVVDTPLVVVEARAYSLASRVQAVVHSTLEGNLL